MFGVPGSLMLITLTQDTITPELARLIKECKRPRALYQAGAKSVQKEISAHLRRLQDRGNVKGWPPQRFFAGRATSVERNVGIDSVTDRSATITIADPRFSHRIAGGVVTPKRKKFSAIPLTAEAYAAAAGRGSIREAMPGLKVIQFKRGLYLCREVGTKTTRGATGKRKFNPVKSLRLIPLFKLVRRVTHRPHPGEMPDGKRLASAAHRDMTAAAKLLLRADH